MKYCLILFIGVLFSQEHYEDLDFICDYDGDGKRNDCELFQQFGDNSWSTKDYRGAVDQYFTMLLCKCINKNNARVYKDLGLSYEKLGLLDSTVWSFEQGLNLDKNNKDLLWNAARILTKLNKNGDKNNLETLYYYFDRLLELEPEDVSILEKYSEVYKNNEQYEEQINILDQWLKIDPNSKRAINSKKNAYANLGMDETEVDKERWEKEPSNLEYGISYVESLMKNENFDKSIEVSEELILLHPEDKRLLKLISESYVKNLDDKKAVKYLEKLIKVDFDNVNVMIDLSTAYMNLYEFNKSYSWANKAINTNKMTGKAFLQRAEVLVQAVDYYRSDELDFCDRLIYDLAREDYQAAYDNGQLNAKIYKNNLKELVTTVGDWFLLGEDFKELSPNSSKCKEQIKSEDYYGFIDRNVARKE